MESLEKNKRKEWMPFAADPTLGPIRYTGLLDNTSYIEPAVVHVSDYKKKTIRINQRREIMIKKKKYIGRPLVC